MRRPRRCWRSSGLLAFAAICAAITVGSTPLAGHAEQRAPSGRFVVVPTPDLRRQASLNAVTALGPHDAWAVGSMISENGSQRTLTLHWNGTRWRRVPSPNRGIRTQLVAVDASSPDNVWAVGQDVDATLRHRTLVMHWDGERWSILPSPDPGEIGSVLNGVAVLAPDDVWVVGGSIVEWPLRGETLALHWTGRRWQREPTPNPSTEGVGSYLHSVDVSGNGDVWAAGAIDRGEFVMGTMVLRRSHAGWSNLATPNSTGGSLAGAITAPRPGHVWTVGWAQRNDGTVRALSLHRTGGRWESSTVRAPSASFADVAVSGGHAWVVGARDTGTFAARHDGRRWIVVPSSSPGEVASTFVGVAPIPGTRCLWAVGDYTHGDRSRPLTERYCPRR